MSRDISPLSYSPLKPMLYANNGNACLNSSSSREIDHYFNSEGMNHRRKDNRWDSSLNSGNFMTRSEIPAYHDRSAESAALAYAYPPDRSYPNGSISERLPYQYSNFHRESERVNSSHHSVEHDYKYGPRKHSAGSGYANGFSCYDDQKDWPSWRMESTSQVVPSNGSYEDSRRRSLHLDYNSPGPDRPSNYDNQKEISSYWRLETPHASSSSWNPTNHEPSKWYPKPAAIQKNLRLLHPKPEPSHSWKRSIHDDHDRKLSSFDNRTIVPVLDRRRIPDNYNADPRRSDNSSQALLAQPMSDYPNRRPQQISIPQPLPLSSVRFTQRERYHDIYRPQDNPRWTPSTYTPKRRPLHRVSARISARPRRSPSPSESSSETSRSRSRQSRRSRSRSRGSDHSNSRHNGHSQSQAHHSLASSKSNGFSESPYIGSNKNVSPSKEPTRVPGPLSSNLQKSGSNSNFRNRLEVTRGRKRRSSSASSYSSENSIRSSVNSDDGRKSNEAAVEISSQVDYSNMAPPDDSPTEPTLPPPQQESFFSIHSQTPLSFPSIEDNLELPGMRFNKSGVLKSDINASASNAYVEVHNDKIEASPPNAVSEVPPLTLNEDPLPERVPNSREADEKVYLEDSELTSRHFQGHLVFAPSKNQLSADDETGINLDKRLDMTTPDNDALSMTESENSFSNSAQTISIKALYQEVPVVSSIQVQTESSPLTDFAPLSSPQVINIIEEASNIEITPPSIEDHDQSAQPGMDLASALRQFVANRIAKPVLPVETRYDHVFEANFSFKNASIIHKQTSNEELVQEVVEDFRFQQRLENHPNVVQVLIEQLRKRSEDFAAKTHRLRTEYKALHMRWVTSCRKLDENLASQTTEPPSPTFRASRRNAGFNDIVRSDLEMEQIIAALGNEDMTDPNVLAIRNTATIPDLVNLDFNNLDVTYIDDSGLVSDPVEFFDTYSALGHWTEEEKDLFLEKFGTYPKQFDVIASFFPGKTPTQCIMFYYLHKKELLDFRAAVKKYGPKRKRGRKGGKGKGKGNALLADIMKPSRGVGEDGHRQMQQFGGMAAINGQKILSRRSLLQGVQIAGGASTMSNGPSGVDAAVKSDGNFKSWSESPEEVDDSAIVVDHRRTRSVKPTESIQEPNVAVVSPEKPKEKAKRPPGRPPKQFKQPARVEESSPSAAPLVKITSYVWTKAEEAHYLKLVKEHGRDIKKIAAGMPAKTELQCRNYFRKHREFERIAKEVEDRLAKSSRP